MAAGLKYNLEPVEKVMPEMCRFETVYRYSGGFNLVTTSLKNVKAIPPLTPLVLDFKARTATPVINVELAENFTSGTAMKIKKGSLAYAGMYIGDGTNGATVSAIDTSSEDYDTLTIDAFDGAPKKGEVLFEASAAAGTDAKATANALNYAWTKVEEGATVTAIGRAFEIRPSRLIAPISEEDKKSLGDRFMFTY